MRAVERRRAEAAVVRAAMYWYRVTMLGGAAISPSLYAKAFYDLGTACALFSRPAKQAKRGRGK